MDAKDINIVLILKAMYKSLCAVDDKAKDVFKRDYYHHRGTDLFGYRVYLDPYMVDDADIVSLLRSLRGVLATMRDLKSVVDYGFEWPDLDFCILNRIDPPEQDGQMSEEE